MYHATHAFWAGGEKQEGRLAECISSEPGHEVLRPHEVDQTWLQLEQEPYAGLPVHVVRGRASASPIEASEKAHLFLTQTLSLIHI